jgi:transcriptional regulator with XRE-family HTH domain
MQNKDDRILKSQIGERFRTFRESLRKTQKEVADELDIYQSTVTNIEKGKTFPKISYLTYLYERYGLNQNWLITGDGDMVFQKLTGQEGDPIFPTDRIKEDDDMYNKYVELLSLMRIPVIEQIILAKLVEMKVLLKDEIKEFQEKIEKKKDEETG